jgi:hypothetical protein
MLAADANLATRDSAKIATGPGEQERADRAAVEAARTAIAMAGTRLAERGQAAAGQQGDAERTEVQARRAAAANPATRASATTKAGEYIKDLAVRDAGKAGGDKAAAAASSGKVAKTMAAAGQEVDAERAEFQSMKAAGANPSTRGGAKTDPGKSVKDLSVRDAEKATANKATAEAPADKATADKATGDKATGDKATGDKSASAANSDKDAGATAAAASGIDSRFAITTFTGKDGQEYIQLPDIRTPGKPGERMQDAETERHSIRPLNQTPDDQKEHWYEKVSDYFRRVGEEIKYDVKRGYQTAQEGLANFENTVKDSAWTFVGGSQLKEQVNSAVATVTNEVKQNADAIGNMVTSPSNQEAIEALGRRALLQVPEQQGTAPSGNAAFILSDSINGQVALSGTIPFGSLQVKAGAKATLELASGTVGKGGSYISKDGQYKLGVTVGVGLPGLPFEVEASVGLTAKAGQIGARVDSVSIEPLVKFDAGKFYNAVKGGYDFVAGLTTSGPTNALASGTELQQLGQDFGPVLQDFQVGGQSLIPAVKTSEATGGSTTSSTSYQPTLPTIPEEGTSTPQPAWVPSGTVNDFRFSIKGTAMNTDVGTGTFRTGWKGDIAGGIEVQQKHYTVGKLQYGTSALNISFELQNVAKAGFAFGTPYFVKNAGSIISA